MPEFPQLNPELTREHALNMILSSIAIEELALSHIINAEGEKIQYILSSHMPCGHRAGTDDVLAVNKSVTGLLETVMQNQMLLKSKMEKVLEYLPKPPPGPPSPPCPPPKPGPGPECGPVNPPSAFEAAPGIYCRGDALCWSEQPCGYMGTGCRPQSCGCTQPCGCTQSCNCTQPCGCGGNLVQIPLPGCCGCLSLHIVLEGCLLTAQPEPVTFELQVACPNKWAVSKCFYHTGGGCRFTLSGNAVIQQGGSPCSCHAALFLRSPQKIRIEQGKITSSCR